MIKLSVVIPYYNETPRGIFPLLASLNGQIGIDFREIEVLLVNDGNGNVLPEEFLPLFFNLNIRVIYLKENKGPGMARQAGMDEAAGGYVMFADADDTLHSVGVLMAFLQVMGTERPDILASPWFEEAPVAGSGFTYILHDNEQTWMHGKAFKLAFLREKNIRFHEKLRVHEDAYFMAIAAMETDNTRRLAIPSYVWRHNPDSITRRDEFAYVMASMPTFIKAMTYVLEEIEKRQPAKVSFTVAELLIYHYFKLHQPVYGKPEHSEWLRDMTAAVGNMLKKYARYYEQAPPELIAIQYERQRNAHPALPSDIQSLKSWVESLNC